MENCASSLFDECSWDGRDHLMKLDVNLVSFISVALEQVLMFVEMGMRC